jgi:hypothetical protein
VDKIEIVTLVTLVARNVNEAVVALNRRSGEIYIWEDSGFSQSVWEESGFSHHEDVFTFNLIYKEILLILYFQCYLQIY